MFHVNGTMQRVAFRVWLSSLRMTSSVPVHVVTGVSSSFPPLRFHSTAPPVQTLRQPGLSRQRLGAHPQLGASPWMNPVWVIALSVAGI